MAIYCPILDDNVLYLDCKDCEDTDMCRKLKLCGSNKDILKKDATDVEKYKNKPNSLYIKNKGDIDYEKNF